MIRSLRRKFIFFAMSAVTVLLAVLFLSVYGLAFYFLDRQEDTVMDELVISNGQFMHKDFRWDPPKKTPFVDIDVMRTARFFIVRIDEAGDVLDTDIDQIFFVSKDEAETYAEMVLRKETDKGRIDGYKYAVKNQDDFKMIFFLDTSREKLTMRTLFLVSVFITILSWLIVLVFVLLASRHVVQPIINGLEKQKQFITNAGHELKTPLAIIQSNNDAMMLIHGENKYNRNIKSQVVRLSELTSNLLMQAKLDEEVQFSKEQLDVSKITEEILLPYEDQAETAGITLRKEISPNVAAVTNREIFIKLVTLLMDNALKYTVKNGSIFFTLAKEAGQVILIEENDCDPELNTDPELLFERFYRADTARTQKDQQSGYGIGLSVARAICEYLGGSLNASYPAPGHIRFIARI